MTTTPLDDLMNPPPVPASTPAINQHLDRKKFLSELLTRIVIVLGLTAVIATVVIQAIVLNETRHLATQSLEQAEANGMIARQIKSDARKERLCATPGTACYKERESATAAIIADVNDITLLTAVCVDSIPQRASALEIRACVVEKLEKEAAKVE